MPDQPCPCGAPHAPIPTSGNDTLCLECGRVSKGPAPAPTYDTGSRTELDAARFEAAHAERPDRRVSRYSGDEFDLAAEVE